MPTAPPTRRRWFRFGLGILPAVALFSCTPGCGRSSIEVPDQLILYSIDGRGERNTSTADELFRGYPVLGKLDIKELTDRKKIMAALDDGIARSSGPPAACFWPRHAMHAIRRGKSVDYVICFECLRLEINEESGTTMKTTTRSPATVFNAYLTKAGILIAPE